jgi:transposase
MSSDNSNPFEALKFFAGFDWGHDTHHVAVFGPSGKEIFILSFDHDAAGWDRLRQKLHGLPGADLTNVGMAIETRHGPAVEKLLEMGCVVYPMNPKAASRYRDRLAPSGTKDDLLDARSFGNALRTDGHRWRHMEPEAPLTQQIRLICRDESSLIEQRTALVCALREAMHEYYPAALEAFEDWTAPSTWAFVKRFPTPQKLAAAGKRAWDKFLHAQKLYRPETYERRIECFRHALDFCGNEPVTAAKTMLAPCLVAQLQTLEKHLDIYRRQIEQLFDQHPCRAIFDSLPGLGPKLAPRMLSECAEAHKRYDSLAGLECCSGAAPIRFQSGQVSVTRMRRACIKPLRHALHLWAHSSRIKSVWAEAYYQGKRQEGKTHACALRCLGRRWLRILWKLLETNQTYDESLHLRNQIKHGSWVLMQSKS